MLEADLEDSDLFFVDDEQEQPVSKFTPEEFLNGLRFPLMEVLKYPYLLCDRDLCKLLLKVKRCETSPLVLACPVLFLACPFRLALAVRQPPHVILRAVFITVLAQIRFCR